MTQCRVLVRVEHVTARARVLKPYLPYAYIKLFSIFCHVCRFGALGTAEQQWLPISVCVIFLIIVPCNVCHALPVCICITACIPSIRLVFFSIPRTAMMPHIKLKHKGFLYLCFCVLAELISPFGITFIIRRSHGYTACSCYQRPARDVDHDLCPVSTDTPTFMLPYIYVGISNSSQTGLID
jgi:hypothetical protein